MDGDIHLPGQPVERTEGPVVIPFHIRGALPISVALAAELARLRQEQKLSLHEVERRSGVSRQEVVLVETGRRLPAFHTVARLVRAYEQQMWVVVKAVEEGKPAAGSGGPEAGRG
jgi:predicted transcriptional regulator